MDNVIKRYEYLFGFVLGGLILALILSGTICLLAKKDKFTSPAYAAISAYPAGEAIKECIKIDRANNSAYLLRMDGKIVKWRAGIIDPNPIRVGTPEMSSLYNPPSSKKVIAAIPAPGPADPATGFGYYPVYGDGTLGNRVGTGDYLGTLLSFQNGRERWLATTSGEVILKYGIFPPFIPSPAVSIAYYYYVGADGFFHEASLVALFRESQVYSHGTSIGGAVFMGGGEFRNNWVWPARTPGWSLPSWP